jgi:succinylglutamate desuccinylase
MNTIEVCRDLMINQASFLDLTRTNELSIPERFSFKTAAGISLSVIDTGVVLIEPADNMSSESSIIISSGVHGNETAPIEIVDQMVKDIVLGRQTVKNRTLVIIGNPVSMNMSQRFKEENLNRLFNGTHKNSDSYESKRAADLERYVEQFFSEEPKSVSRRYHYDLHTAIRKSMHRKFTIYPYPDGRDWSQEQLAFFLSSDINTILLGHQPSGTFSYYTSHQFKADAFTVELGRVKGFGENDMSEFVAIDTNLRALIAGTKISTKPFKNSDFNLFQVQAELVKKDQEKFRLHIADDVKNFTEFSTGYQLTDDSDGGYTVQEDGEAIVFPNAKVPVGQRAGLVVKRTQI